MRLTVTAALGAAFIPLGTVAGVAQEAPAAHVAIHVDSDDPATINMALGNAENIEKFYDSKDQTVAIEFVANGPGLAMLRDDISPVKDKIAKMVSSHEDLTFSACQNSINAVEKKTGQKLALLPDTTIVPSGAVRLIELQSEGYAYLRP